MRTPPGRNPTPDQATVWPAKARTAVWLVGLALGLGAWAALAGAMVVSTLPPHQRVELLDALALRWPLLGMAYAVGVAALAGMVHFFYRRYVRSVVRLNDHANIALQTHNRHAMPSEGPPELRNLAGTLDALVSQRDILRATMREQFADASRQLEREKSRLAALVAELSQGVLVCNLDGKIVLYNRCARLQLKALSVSPEIGDGADAVGIGRSVYTLFDRQWLGYALDSLSRSQAQGMTNPSAQFVIGTKGSQLLRVHLMQARSQDGEDAYSGFVMLLDNITRSFEEEAQHEKWLQGLSTDIRTSLGYWLHLLDQELDARSHDTPLEAGRLEQVKNGLSSLRAHVEVQAQTAAQSRKGRWLQEEMQGSDLLQTAQRWLQMHWKRSVTVEPVDSNLWLKVDSFSLLQALTHMAGRVVEEFDVRFLQLRLQSSNGQALLDLVWNGAAMSTETVMGWELCPMQVGGQTAALSVRDVLERHGGNLWFERERVNYKAFFRFSLPLAVRTELEVVSEAAGRPVYYDFDLLQGGRSDLTWDETPLRDLAFTVFDTETTGLRPSDGDEIIQIGAVRIVNGKLLLTEHFDQLVNPGRTIPPATVPIHGISQDMVDGKPGIGPVIEAFHAFAAGTVLVAHNAAFDMKFLQMKERLTGLRFDGPVLDTLLLSAVVHPHHDSHRLEALAERFQLEVTGRHTALGDAMVTARIWLHLLPLLEAIGIRTLGQARAAGLKSKYAKIQY